MKAFTHVVFGGACFLAAARLGLVSNEGLQLITAMTASLLPDLDCPGSYIGRRLRCISVPLGCLLGHRGFSHSGLCALIIIVAFAVATRAKASVPTALAIGYLSHLLGDYLSSRGIPLLWPRPGRVVAPPLLRMQVGGTAEMTLTAVLVVVVAWLSGVLPIGMLAGIGVSR